MLEIAIIGNLTSDAAIKDWNGKSFLSFSVAENQSYTGADGVKREKTTYISCLKPIRGEGGNLAQYLKKGTQVFVRGRASAKVFTRNDGTVDASLNCSADHVQLLASPRKDQNSPADGFSRPPVGTCPTPTAIAPQTAKEPTSQPSAAPITFLDEPQY